MKFFIIGYDTFDYNDKKYYRIYILDVTNKCVSKVNVSKDDYDDISKQMEDSEELFINCDDNIALRYDTSNACYKLNYRR